ncbi:hypothetical protein [Okeania sp. SIO1H4]|nr:hypothetical protein [Okeania sp. SIO1H4]
MNNPSKIKNEKLSLTELLSMGSDVLQRNLKAFLVVFSLIF